MVWMAQGSGQAGLFLRRWGLDVRPGERPLTALLSLSFFLVVTFQYVAKTVRQSTFVDTLGSAKLPYVYLLVALCSYPLLRLYVRYAGRLQRHRFIMASCSVVALSLLGFWWLFRYPWPWLPVAFYVWITIAFGALVSQFWLFSSHLLDPRQAKRLFGVIGAGGLLGGIAGGQVARLTTSLLGTRAAFVVAAAILAAIIVLVAYIHRLYPEEPQAVGGERPENKGGRSGLQALLGSRHLQLIGLVLVLSVMVGQIVDLQFNWAIEQSTTTLAERTARFGNFFSIIGLAALVFQLLFTSTIHRSLGVGFGLRVLPVVAALGAGLILAFSGMLPGLMVGAILSVKVGEAGLRYSLDQSTRELLFLPVPSALRARGKAFIDVFLQRLAKGAAALLLLPVAFGLLAPPQVSWIILVLCAVWMMAATVTYRVYVQSFRAGLKDRTVEAAISINVSDVKTVELLVESLGSTDRRQVLHSLEILQANGRGNLVPPLLLYHDDAEVRRRTLRVLADIGRSDAAPLVERCLADDDPEVRAEAIRVLTGFGSGSAGDLMHARLQESDPKVRAAAITCLLEYGTAEQQQQAEVALRGMLGDAGPEYRAEAVKALGALRGSRFEGALLNVLEDPDSHVVREAVYAVRRILRRDGFNPLFLPRLISLLQDRRVKLDAREVLVEFGQECVPILVHFLNDPGESIFVRRAIPKALIRIGGPQVVQALVKSLLESRDAFLRAQLVEALASEREPLQENNLTMALGDAIQVEARGYLVRLADLLAVGGTRLRFEGPVVGWDRRDLDLLSQMLAERLEQHLRTMFGLLALLHPPHDVWAAYHGLISGRSALRVHALEYLDNTLSGNVRRKVFAVIDDLSPQEKIRAAKLLFGVIAVTRESSVRSILSAAGDHDDDAVALTVAALYTLYTENLTGLFPLVARVLELAKDPLVRETAEWVSRRVSRATSPQEGSS